MKFNILAMFRRSVAVAPSEVPTPLDQLPIPLLEAMAIDTRAEHHKLNDALYIARARKSGQQAYRVDFNFTLGSERHWKTFWKTSASPHDVLEDLRQYVVRKRNTSRISYVIGEAVLTNLLTGDQQHRDAHQVFAAA